MKLRNEVKKMVRRKSVADIIDDYRTKKYLCVLFAGLLLIVNALVDLVAGPGMAIAMIPFWGSAMAGAVMFDLREAIFKSGL